MSSERPSASGVAGVRARYSIASPSKIGCVRLVRHDGSGTRRRLDTSLTRIPNDDERAPITIDARSAVERGSAASRISSTSSRDARCADCGPPSGTSPPR